MWNLSFLTRIEPVFLALGTWNFNHWTTREVPACLFSYSKNIFWVSAMCQALYQALEELTVWVHFQFSSIAQTYLTLCNPAAHQALLSITNSWSLLKLTSIELVMPSSHFILCHPLLLLPSIFPSIRVFSNESILHIRWPKYWSFNLSNQSFRWIFRTDFFFFFF